MEMWKRKTSFVSKLLRYLSNGAALTIGHLNIVRTTNNVNLVALLVTVSVYLISNPEKM